MDGRFNILALDRKDDQQNAINRIKYCEDSFTFEPNYLAKRNRKYAIRRALFWIALAIGLIAFAAWGWNLPEV